MDSQEFQHIYEQILPQAIGMAGRALNHPEDARDVVQDAFVKALLALNSFRGDAKFTTWFYRILINTCLTRNLRPDRAKRLQVPLEDAIGEEDNSLLDWELPSPRADSDDIHELIFELPLRQAHAVRLFYYHRYDYQQVANAMNISPAAVASLLHRGRQGLQKLITNTRRTTPR